MAEYKLKAGQEAFRVVDGPFRKRFFEPGEVYNEIPPEEKKRFDEIRPAKVKKAVEKKEGEQS